MTKLPFCLTAFAFMFGGAAYAQDASCTITDGGDLNQTASCKILDEGASLEFKGTIEENEVNFIALADRDAGTALLIGAGTFFLAKGEAEISDDAMIWPNGYEVRLTE